MTPPSDYFRTLYYIALFNLLCKFHFIFSPDLNFRQVLHVKISTNIWRHDWATNNLLGVFSVTKQKFIREVGEKRIKWWELFFDLFAIEEKINYYNHYFNKIQNAKVLEVGIVSDKGKALQLYHKKGDC